MGHTRSCEKIIKNKVSEQLLTDSRNEFLSEKQISNDKKQFVIGSNKETSKEELKEKFRNRNNLKDKKAHEKAVKDSQI